MQTRRPCNACIHSNITAQPPAGPSTAELLPFCLWRAIHWLRNRQTRQLNLRTARRDDDSSVATYSLATRESRLPGAPPPLSPRPRSPSLARSSIMRYAFARGACSRGLHACLTNSFINGGWTRTVSWSGWGPRSIWISDAPGKTGPGFRVELFVGLAQALPLPLLHHGNASVDPYCVGMRHHP